MPKVGFKHSKETKIKMSKSHTGLKFSKEHAANHKKATTLAARRPENRINMSRVKKGVHTILGSRNGADEMNHGAKNWWFIKNGVHYKFRNLSKFVRDNRDLFNDDELKVYKGDNRLTPPRKAVIMLRNLLLTNKDGTPKIATMQWHGWTVGEKRE